MKNGSFFLFIGKFLLLFSLSLLSFCSKQNDVTYTDTLRIATGLPMGKVTPVSDFGIGANMAELVYYPLFTLNKEGDLIPILAESVVLEDEGKVLRVKLKLPIAKDVKNTFEEVNELKSKLFKQSFKNLKSIEIVSPKEVVFHFAKYDRFLLFDIARTLIMANSRNDPATGEFEVIKESDDQIILKRKSFRADKINFIKVSFISSQRLALRELVAGNIDLLFYPTQGEYQSIKGIPNITIQELSINFIFLLLKSSWNKSQKIDWHEISERVNRQELTRIYGEEFSTEATIPVPRTSPWFDPAVEKFAINYQSKASRVQKNTDSIRSLYFWDSKGKNELIVRVLKRKMEELGVDVQLKKISPKEYEKNLVNRKVFDLFLVVASVRDAFITNYLGFHSAGRFEGYNYSGYVNPKVDLYLDKARYSQDFVTAKQAFGEAIKEIIKDPPGLFLFWVKFPVIYRSSCSGFKFNVSEFYMSLKDVSCQTFN